WLRQRKVVLESSQTHTHLSQVNSRCETNTPQPQLCVLLYPGPAHQGRSPPRFCSLWHRGIMQPGCSSSAQVIWGMRGVSCNLGCKSRDLEMYSSWRDGRLQPITFSAEWMTRCSLALSLAVAAANQTVMEDVRIDSMMAV
ncbi:hypothetical protein QTP70_014892, partial [Hemibagrus guttatus]